MAALSPEQAANIPANLRVLELGCGKKRIVAHSVTVDFNEQCGADVTHDLNRFPYPFEDNSFDIVIAEHLLEHLDNVIATVEEVHRICSKGARFYVEVPHFSSADFHTDPTHRHAFSSRSFDYFVRGTELYGFEYSRATFVKHSVSLSGHSRYLTRWINQHLELYERRFAFLYPGNLLNFELEPVKP